MSTYHLWERQLQELFLEQKDRLNIEIPLSRPREDMVCYAERILREVFDAEVSQEYWLALNRARIVVNAFKHGAGRRFEAAMRLYPEYFFAPRDGRHLPVVAVSLEQLKNLIRVVANFWDGLPRKVNYAR